MTKRTILIVDDDRDMLDIISAMIESMGYLALVADSGGKALDCIREITPALILLDVNLKDICGFDVMLSVRKDKLCKDVPIIFFSASSKGKILFDEMLPDKSIYLVKPVEYNVLEHEIRMLLENDKFYTALRKSKNAGILYQNIMPRYQACARGK